MAPKKPDTYSNRNSQNMPEDDRSDTYVSEAPRRRSHRSAARDNAANNDTAPESASDDSGDYEAPSDDDEENPEEDSGEENNQEEDNEEEEPEPQDDENVGNEETKKPGGQKLPKMNWNAANDRKLLLIMVTSPEKCTGSAHLQEIADMFREKPTPKAIQVRISKLREDGKALMQSADGSQRNTKRPREENDDTPADDRPGQRPRLDRPDVDLGQAVFEDFPVTWGDLPEDLRNDVRHIVDRRTQEMGWDAQGQDWVRRHNRQYDRQLQRQQESQRERQKAEDAAQALVELSRGNGGQGGSDAAQNSPEKSKTDLERQTEAMLKQLTGRWDTEEGNDGGKGDDDGEGGENARSGK